MSVRDLLADFHNYLDWVPNWLLAAFMLAVAASGALLVHRAAGAVGT